MRNPRIHGRGGTRAWALALAAAMAASCGGGTRAIDRELREAAGAGDAAGVQTALGGGADVNAANEEGSTALHLAMTGHHAGAGEALIEAGADANARDNTGSTPLIVMLLRQPADKDDEAAWAARTGVARSLLDAGTEVDAANWLGQTALRYAVSDYHRAMVRLLVERGADPERADNFGQTPLGAARQLGFAELVEIMETGAGAEPPPRG